MTKINGERWPVRAVSGVASVKLLVASMAADSLYRFTVSIIGRNNTLHSLYRLCPCPRSATRLAPSGRGTSSDASWWSPRCRRRVRSSRRVSTDAAPSPHPGPRSRARTARRPPEITTHGVSKWSVLPSIVTREKWDSSTNWCLLWG